ncbi:MAG: hypothetical protein CMH56_15190 [Myxococcales bacterium]|nr:hypothetical protein [Myxococcales bacterium]|tara:strand:- start:1347 stop:1850 length:504 start_codon:yes stop_codon:yes gene_type:complete
MTSSVRPISQSKLSSKPNLAASHLLPLTLAQLDRLQADTLMVGIHQDVRPLKGAAGFIDWRLCGEISNLLRNQSFHGEPGEVLLISGRGRLPAIRIFLMGWGPVKASVIECQKRCEQMVRSIEMAGAHKVAIALPEPCEALITPAESMLKERLGSRFEGIFAPEGQI